jgi:hypothetical protein
MALATNIKPLGNELNIDLQRKLTSFLYNSQLKAKYFLGLLGVILISIPFLIISPIFHIVLRSANKRLQQQLKDVYNWMNDASMSELIDAHLIIERNNKEYLQLLNMNKIIDKNPATMGISSEINKLVIQIVDLESSLKRAAYPNINKDLTVAELQELSDIFSDTINWKDENLDVYENYV